MEYKFLATMQAAMVEYVDMLESLRRGAEVVYDSPDAMLLVDSGTYMLAAVDKESALVALERFPAGARNIVVRQEELLPYLAERWNMTEYSKCVQVWYAAPTPPIVGGRFRISRPVEADWEAVLATYHLIPPEQLRLHFDSPDFFCAYDGDELVGYAGLHTEGALGMLYVFPAHRRQGVAEELTAYLVARQMSLGRYAYAHIFVDNAASLALQRKVNMSFANNSIWWVWNKASRA